MDVSVVITCWNGRRLLEKNFPLVLKAAENPKNQIKEIIIVDDYSSDSSTEYIRKFIVRDSKFKIHLVEHKRNYGYSRTCNTGVNEAREELVAILNLDVVPTENFLEAALPHFQDEKLFAVSFNEWMFGPGKIVWEKGMLGIEQTKLPVKTCLTGWPSGGSSVFRKNTWENLGGMDEIFLPFYFEDIDLGIRAYKAGYRCLFEPKSKVRHEHEATINKENFNQKYINNVKQRNLLLLTWKNLDSKRLYFSHILGLVERILLHPKYLLVVWSAFKKTGQIKKETKEMRKSSVRDILAINEKIS